jgi:hypothetical protein
MEQVVQLRRTKLGEDHPDTLHSIELLAYITERNSGNSQTNPTSKTKKPNGANRGSIS